MTLKNLFSLAAMTVVLAACGGGGGGGDAQPVANPPASVNYAGTYNCTIAGTSTGSLNFVMANPTGAFSSCSGSTSPGGSFSCTGSISASGVLTSAFASTGATANGQVNATGASATWSNGPGAGGTISCTKLVAPTPVTGAVTAADKFVGSWGSCTPVTGAANGVVSVRTLFVYTKTGATTLNLSVDGQSFKAANCSGAVFNNVPAIGTAAVTLNGTKLVGTQTVDRLDYLAKSTDIAAFNGNLKDIALVTGTTLTFGASSLADANGYPTVLDTADVLTKQ
jgi:hypothetical protein